MGSSRGSKWLKYLKNLGTKSLYFFCILCYNINNKKKGKEKEREDEKAEKLSDLC